VFRLDGSFVRQFYPQIHHQCQCGVVSLAERDIDEAMREMLEGEDPTPMDADPGFLFDPGDAYYVEARGQEPATEAGREDVSVLQGLPGVDVFL
jgi:hypothetical protein